MTKIADYLHFVEYLRDLKKDEVDLSFEDIEKILGKKLPGSARKHDAWWYSTKKEQGHILAYLWQKEGWERYELDRKRERIILRRQQLFKRTDVAVIDDLRPLKLEYLFDLLVQANISVDAWNYTKSGQLVKKPKANPNYCYNWSFGSEKEGFVLCVWHSSLIESDGEIAFESSARKLAADLDAIALDKNSDSAKKIRALQQASRARQVDSAMAFSCRTGMPVRVIFTDGDRRKKDELGETSSTVHFRSLDLANWYVHRYEKLTGNCLLVRGVKPLDDFGNTLVIPENESEDAIQLRAIRTRRGQTKFRQALLNAYGKRCAVTGSKIEDLLEAAHITPHSKGQNYSVTNGLLLRADIHSLYDLKLLSIDENGNIHLSEKLKDTEYGAYADKCLTFPKKLTDQPSVSALNLRHKHFLGLK